MYYIEPKDSDMIEMQNARSEADVIDFASSMVGEQIREFSTACNVLNNNGYIVFEDC